MACLPEVDVVGAVNLDLAKFTRRHLPRDGEDGEGALRAWISGLSPRALDPSPQGGGCRLSFQERHHSAAAPMTMPEARFFSISRMARRYSTGMTLTNLGRMSTQLSRICLALVEPV